MDLNEVGWEGVDWIHLAEDRHKWCVLLNMIMTLWFKLGGGRFFN